MLVCLFVMLASFAVAQSDDQPTGTITVDDSASQDAAIAIRIREILAELEGYSDVTVSVSSG
ncbi:MAG: mechanosensitive ion channel protein MscS, partial [Marinovum sp.]|nr:mechanosensitive ion channel protein MscS [Marinovum sp.]